LPPDVCSDATRFVVSMRSIAFADTAPELKPIAPFLGREGIGTQPIPSLNVCRRKFRVSLMSTAAHNPPSLECTTNAIAK